MTTIDYGAGDTGLTFTKREYAAIHLRVADSGDADLDAMIRQANRMRIAAMMAVPSVYGYTQEAACRRALDQADALLAALEAKP